MVKTKIFGPVCPFKGPRGLKKGRPGLKKGRPGLNKGRPGLKKKAGRGPGIDYYLVFISKDGPSGRRAAARRPEGPS